MDSSFWLSVSTNPFYIGVSDYTLPKKLCYFVWIYFTYTNSVDFYWPFQGSIVYVYHYPHAFFKKKAKGIL